MKFILLFVMVVGFLFVEAPLYADRIDIPFSCYPKQVQERFAKHGKKLDISANDRDEKSWGFLESHGSNFTIYTYCPLDIPKELEEVKLILMEN